MEAWLRAEHRPVVIFDGTLGSLIDIYASDPESPYRELKYSTQQAYDDDLKAHELRQPELALGQALQF